VPGDRVLLGVSVESATDGGRGVRVVRVISGSPADEAGLETGDIITRVDDTEIGDASELVRTIASHDPGDTVTVTYERDGESNTTDATLGGGTES
jgi:putative serine protease PepD